MERGKAEKICIAWQTGAAKVFSVQFWNSQLLVHFPYQPNSSGIAARVELRPGKTQYRLVDEFSRITAHKVKYSHPIDGKAHFSQDRRVVTTVRTDAVRLYSHSGHLFTVQVQGLDDFAEMTDAEYREPSCHMFEFDLARPPESVRIVGRWVEMLSPDVVSGPVLTRHKTTGVLETHLGIIPPPAFGVAQRGLLLVPVVQDPYSSRPGAVLSFQGGFDPHIGDPGADSSFLTLTYPYDKDEIPKEEFDSMDFVADLATDIETQGT